MNLVSDFGIRKIVAHLAFKFHSVASGTFPTASTRWVRGAVLRVLLNPMVRQLGQLLYLDTLYWLGAQLRLEQSFSGCVDKL
jgi:hypothetical protein